jgi:hypothetical protein
MTSSDPRSASGERPVDFLPPRPRFVAIVAEDKQRKHHLHDQNAGSRQRLL